MTVFVERKLQITFLVMKRKSLYLHFVCASETKNAEICPLGGPKVNNG